MNGLVKKCTPPFVPHKELWGHVLGLWGSEMSDLVLWITLEFFGVDFFGFRCMGLVGDFWHNDRYVVIKLVKILYFCLQGSGDFCLGLVVVVGVVAGGTIEKRPLIMFLPREAQKICDTPIYKAFTDLKIKFSFPLFLSRGVFCKHKTISTGPTARPYTYIYIK